MKKYCFGIDVGGTTVKMGLFRVDGELLEKWEIPSRTENEGKAILPDIAEAVQKKLEERGIEKDSVTGIGIGVPGPINAEGIVPHTANLGWGYKEVTRELTELTGLVSKGGNDANVAALGEMWKGAAAGHKSGVMVTLGTGVGGGVILDQKIIAGKHGLGGEIGHIHVRDDEWEHCNCGGVGCLEQVSSATGIAREARRTMAKSDKPSALREFGDNVSAKDVLDAAKAGDEMALEVMKTVSHYLGLALAQVALTVDPEIFVIGGGVSKAGQFLIDMIQKDYDHFTPISENKAKLGLATLGNDAGIYGAARLVL